MSARVTKLLAAVLGAVSALQEAGYNEEFDPAVAVTALDKLEDALVPFGYSACEECGDPVHDDQAKAVTITRVDTSTGAREVRIERHCPTCVTFAAGFGKLLQDVGQTLGEALPVPARREVTPP